ncbi:MAG: ATP-binding protein [Thermoplasmata archaeon]|nr:ATP-binding protein [Thermoplasmata archaeon]
MESLADGSGRTVVIAGPDGSGKSALLERFLAQLESTSTQVRSGRGVYRERESPFSAITSLSGSGEKESSDPWTGTGPEEEPELVEASPIAGLAYLPPPTSAPRRARGERQKGRVLGVSYAVRTRGVQRVEPAAYWSGLVDELEGPNAVPIAITIEDGAFVDAESRDLLLYLSERARLRPLLLVLVLDSSDPSFPAWEERLMGRRDVDWVRTPSPQIDPREISQVRRAFEMLPAGARRVLTLTCLMGGSVSEVHLARIARLTFSELADAILPASEAHLVRVEPGRVIVPHQPWIRFFPGLSPAPTIRDMHREIAEALEALNPEPSLSRRRELADHFFEAEPGPVALRYLLESAELTAQLLDFDAVEALLGRALQCVPSLPASDRAGVEAELRLFRARALLFSGRSDEAEREIGEAITVAVREHIAEDRLEEWIEPLLVALQAVGPRPSLVNQLVELADRLDGAGYFGIESLLNLVVVEDEVQRERLDKARHESHRVGQLARQHPATPPLAAVALMSVGLTRAPGGLDEQAKADRYLRSAALALGQLRRPELEQMAIEYRSRLLALQGKVELATNARQQAISVAQRLRLPSIEALHQLGLAEMTLDRGANRRSEKALRRARELVEQLYLGPPALAILRLWLLEGRQLAADSEIADARDRWSTLGDRVGGGVPRGMRGEALLRLATLELLHGRPEAAESAFSRPEVAELFGDRPREFTEWSAQIRELGDAAQSGGAVRTSLMGG